ncbi:MAG: hypothetical protein HGA45_05500 [Chloroflexales bacterium]|nr:hypothetical protein [Chloroflexales bacterium]
MSTMVEPRSDWQRRIEGVWHGMPAVFDPAGGHLGFIHSEQTVERDESGAPVYRVRDQAHFDGPLRDRLTRSELDLRILDTGASRVYVGRDIFGAGQPFGPVLLGSDYIQPWGCDSSLIVQLLGGGTLKVYSVLLYQGPALLAALHGCYLLTYDHADSPATRDQIAAFFTGELAAAPRPYAHLTLQPGFWGGVADVYAGDGRPLGQCEVTIAQRPLDPVEVELDITISGSLSYSWRCARRRHDHHYHFAGPDLFGNGAAYGRALFTTCYVRGQTLKIVGREVPLDQRHTLSVVWQIIRDDHSLEAVISGALEWHDSYKLAAQVRAGEDYDQP